MSTNNQPVTILSYPGQQTDNKNTGPHGPGNTTITKVTMTTIRYSDHILDGSANKILQPRVSDKLTKPAGRHKIKKKREREKKHYKAVTRLKFAINPFYCNHLSAPLNNIANQ